AGRRGGRPYPPGRDGHLTRRPGQGDRAPARSRYRCRRGDRLGGAGGAMTAASAKRIGVVTVSRSDYGHLRPVLDALRRAPDLELALFVAGMHLAPEFGLTVRDIEADGVPISARVEMLEGGDTPDAVAAATGRGGA